MFKGLRNQIQVNKSLAKIKQAEKEIALKSREINGFESELLRYEQELKRYTSKTLRQRTEAKIGRLQEAIGIRERGMRLWVEILEEQEAIVRDLNGGC